MIFYRLFKSVAIFTLLVSVAGAGCKKLDLAPSDRFTELTFWQSDLNVNNALNNVYGGLYTSNRVFYNDALSDNAFSRLAGTSNVDAIASGSFTATLPRFQNDWAFYYGGIKSCNIFLENVDNNTTLPEALKTRMKAEVRFVRAFHHANLMKWWGAVPLLQNDLTPDEAKLIGRSPRAQVLDFILQELDAAAAALPTREEYAAADNGRITQGAAMALKARVLLYEGDRMAEAAEVYENLLNGNYGNYGLADNYSNLFSNQEVNSSSNEVMLSLQYVPTLRMWGDYIDLAPISAGARTGGMSPTQELVDAYLMLNGKAINEPGSGYLVTDPYSNRDPRLTATIVYDRYVWQNPDGSTQTIYIRPQSTPSGASSANEYSTAGQGSVTGYYWRKYWDPEYAPPGISSGLNIHLLRFAEVLLGYAEAKQELGQMTEEIWNQTIRALRERAGFTDPDALNYPGNTNMTNIIRRERRVEFAMEGIRIDDIRRWRIAEDVMSGWAHGARYDNPAVDNGYIRVQLRTFDPNKHYLWPVPPSERVLNPNLTQNTGH